MKPLPQQTIITDFLITHPEAAIFADPGTGKSRAVIDAVKWLLADCAIKGVLIIAPLRVATLTWPDEFDKWEGLNYADLRTTAGLDAWDNGAADAYILNYEQIQPFVVKCLKKRKFIPVDMLVFDESSKTRNPSSVRMKALAPYRHFFKRFVGLTGTPQPNSCLDLFGQIKVLDGGKRLGTSFHQFRNKYATSDFMGFTWEVMPGSEEMIRERISDMVLVMRGEDWLDIPAVTFEDIEIALPADVMSKYKRLQKDFLIEIECKEVTALNAASLVQKLSQFTSGASYYDDNGERKVVEIHDAKIKALRDLHQKIGYRPLLVFTQFIHEAERICAHIPLAQVFDGNKLDQWNAGKIPMFVAHPKSAGFGLQMQGTCHDVVWFTLGYSSEDYKQGCARVARTGQKNPVTVYRLLCTGTVDWVQAEVIRTKGDGEAALKSALRHLKKLASVG